MPKTLHLKCTSCSTARSIRLSDKLVDSLPLCILVTFEEMECENCAGVIYWVQGKEKK